MSEEPRASFVIPCYNYGRFLAQAVDSLLSQTLDAIEVIVVDDASTDETREILQRYAGEPRVRVIRHTENKGHIFSYNEGLALTRGEFVGLLSADDFCLCPDAVVRQVAMFDAHPSAGFVYSELVVPDDNGNPRWVFRAATMDRVRDGLDEFADLMYRNYVPHSGTLVRRSCHTQVGYYDPRLPHAADWELWLRLCTRWQVGYIAAPLYAYRVHETNMNYSSISPAQANSDAVLTIQKAFDALPPNAPVALRRMRPAALRAAWLGTSDLDRRRGKIRRSWEGLLDVARRSPGLLARPEFHNIVARLLLLTVLGRYHVRLAAWRAAWQERRPAASGAGPTI